jgi:hypothetical protein
VSDPQTQNPKPQTAGGRLSALPWRRTRATRPLVRDSQDFNLRFISCRVRWRLRPAPPCSVPFTPNPKSQTLSPNHELQTLTLLHRYNWSAKYLRHAHSSLSITAPLPGPPSPLPAPLATPSLFLSAQIVVHTSRGIFTPQTLCAPDTVRAC